MNAIPASARNRYFGVVRLAFGGSLMLKLLDGRRAHVPPQELRTCGTQFAPGDRVEVSAFTRGDGTLPAFDLLRVED